MNRIKLLQFKNKTVTLDELKIKGITESEIQNYVNEGGLIPIKKSGTNGNLINPLYKKYRIVSPEKDYSDTLKTIKSLHPKLIENGYLLKKPDIFTKNCKGLFTISKFLHSSSSLSFISRRERSFQIFGDEKYLDNNLSLMQKVGLTSEDLKYYTTPEQCFSDYIPIRKEKMTLLICENKDIWFNLRRLMSEYNIYSFFGVKLDGVIFGQGNDITGKGKFTSYARFLSTGKIHFLYCGDIDKAGFDIFFRLCNEASELDIKLFIPVYQKMLELADISNLPESDDKRDINVETKNLIPLFSKKDMNKINEILNAGKRLPQEIINYMVLKENAR